jgi:hypothetical protein
MKANKLVVALSMLFSIEYVFSLFPNIEILLTKYRNPTKTAMEYKIHLNRSKVSIVEEDLLKSIRNNKPNERRAIKKIGLLVLGDFDNCLKIALPINNPNNTIRNATHQGLQKKETINAVRHKLNEDIPTR